MKRALLVLLVLLWSARADAHVGSPDVFFESDAGPYHLFVTIRVPQVIPGIATIEIRSSSPDVTGLSVVPMRLTGPGSELPPTADPAVRSADDPQFFTANLWGREWFCRSSRGQNGSQGIDGTPLAVIYVRSGRGEVGSREVAAAEADHG